MVGLMLSAIAVASEVPCTYCDSLYRASIAEPGHKIWNQFAKECLHHDTAYYYLDGSKIKSKRRAYYYEIISNDSCSTFYSYQRISLKTEGKGYLYWQAYKGDTTLYEYVSPEFTGGQAGLHKFLRTNVKYPEKAERNEIQGIVWVSFVVEENGEIKDISIYQGYQKSLNEEAIRLISIMPPWTPGLYRDKPVKTRMKMPIEFKLQ